jgi:hypothetical protein
MSLTDVMQSVSDNKCDCYVKGEQRQHRQVQVYTVEEFYIFQVLNELREETISDFVGGATEICTSANNALHKPRKTTE